MRRVAIALVHYPVLDGRGEIVTTAVTNLDVHDLARTARSYGASDYFVVHPIAAQRDLVSRILEHWTVGSSGRRMPDRREALTVLRITSSLESAVESLGGGEPVEVWVTAARDVGTPLPFAAARAAERRWSARSHCLRNRLGSRFCDHRPFRRTSRAHSRRRRGRLQSPQRPRRLCHRDGSSLWQPIVGFSWLARAHSIVGQQRRHLRRVPARVSLDERRQHAEAPGAPGAGFDQGDACGNVSRAMHEP